MAHVSDLIATDIDAYLHAARAQEPAALHHLRQRRRRQEHADRPAAVRLEDDLRGPAGRARGRLARRWARRAASSTSRCWSTAWRPSASRASRSTSPTASSPPTSASSSSPTRPGHEQYTRNMVTGASTADLAVILIDARKGVLTQTRRHSYLVSLIGIRKVVLAINKMDLVDYSRGRSSTRIVADYRAFAQADRPGRHHRDPAVGAARATTSPAPSEHMPWYHGPTLMGYLETVRGRRRTRQQPAVPPAGAVGQPARTSTSAASPARSPAASVQPGDAHPRAALGPREPRSARIVTARRRPRRGRRRPVGDADARRRDRHLAAAT